MKKIIFSAVCLAAITVQAQVTVVGVGSSQYSRSNVELKGYPGGSSPDSYTKIDDGEYECLYQYKAMAKTKAGDMVEETYYCMLDFGKNAARFCDYSVYRADSAVVAQKPNPDFRSKINSELGKQKYRFFGDVIQNYPQGKLTYTDIVTPDYLEYTEQLGSMPWKIGEETDTVCGYLCTKATASYGGRDWTAWYAEDIPSRFGPWKFNGLPGLILKVSDSEGLHDFSAISIKKGDTPIVKPKNELIVKTTRDKFVENKNLFEKDPYGYIPSDAIRNMDVFPTGQVMVNGVEVPRRPNGYTPIELK